MRITAATDQATPRRRRLPASASSPRRWSLRVAARCGCQGSAATTGGASRRSATNSPPPAPSSVARLCALAAGMDASADAGAASLNHRCTKFALTPRASATPATDAPGSRHACTTSALNSRLCRRRPTLLSSMVSIRRNRWTPPLPLHNAVSKCRAQPLTKRQPVNRRRSSSIPKGGWDDAAAHGRLQNVRATGQRELTTLAPCYVSRDRRGRDDDRRW